MVFWEWWGHLKARTDCVEDSFTKGSDLYDHRNARISTMIGSWLHLVLTQASNTWLERDNERELREKTKT